MTTILFHKDYWSLKFKKFSILEVGVDYNSPGHSTQIERLTYVHFISCVQVDFLVDTAGEERNVCDWKIKTVDQYMKFV